MPEYEQAEAVAQAWVEVCTRGGRELDPDAVIVRPYGWAFGFRDAPGRGPYIGGWIGVLFDSVNGDVMAIGVGHGSMEAFLAGYETTIPVARLTMKPEFPPNGTHYRGFFGIIDPDKPVELSKLPEPFRELMSRKPWWKS